MPTYEDYIEMIKPLWETKRITNMGNYHAQLEDSLEEFLDVPYVSLMTNGHLSLEMAIQAMDFPKGSEVITTPFTFISTTHAIVRNGLTPIFCDIKSDNYTIDESKIENLITEKTVAIVPVHVYGNICNIEEIQKISSKYRLKVIYDAAHAFGEHYKGQGIANFGDASIFSFHATKVFNTIEGGAVAFSESSLYERLFNLKNFGIRGEEIVVEVGANTKMNEFSAAMGLCNLKNFTATKNKRKENAELYMSHLASAKNIILPQFENKDIEFNYGYFPVRFLQEGMRDYIYNELKKENIYTRKYFYPITSDAACFKNKYKSMPLQNARAISDNILVLPLYSNLKRTDIDRICKILLQKI